MAFMTSRVKVEDYDAWKAMFDTDPAGVRAQALGHRIFRLADDPNELMIVVEFGSADDATAAREKLIASGILDRVTVTLPPAVVTEADAVTY